MKMTYRYEESYLFGGRGVCIIWNCPSRSQADAAALAMGWKPPRWWQWRRWLDWPRKVNLRGAQTMITTTDTP
jgi:hypothetical protein